MIRPVTKAHVLLFWLEANSSAGPVKAARGACSPPCAVSQLLPALCRVPAGTDGALGQPRATRASAPSSGTGRGDESWAGLGWAGLAAPGHTETQRGTLTPETQRGTLTPETQRGTLTPETQRGTLTPEAGTEAVPSRGKQEHARKCPRSQCFIHAFTCPRAPVLCWKGPAETSPAGSLQQFVAGDGNAAARGRSEDPTPMSRPPCPPGSAAGSRHRSSALNLPSKPRINYSAAPRTPRNIRARGALAAPAPRCRTLHAGGDGWIRALCPGNPERWHGAESEPGRDRFLLEARGSHEGRVVGVLGSLGTDPCAMLHARGWPQPPDLAQATGTVAPVLLQADGNWELGGITLGCFTPNPSLGSSTEGACRSRSGWEPSRHGQPPCLGGPYGDRDGANPGAAQAPPPDIPGCPSCSQTCPGWRDELHPWPGRGRKVPGEGDKGEPGTQHPRVMLRGDPVEAGAESLSGDMNGHDGRSQAPARGLTLKKKKVYLFQDLTFFFSPFLLFLPVFQKKWGKSTKKVSCGTAKV
ncbi:uncharacterized protein LOC129046940 [Molothrus ater]|uniref:uncharacterized protein LOC129046940 n=1 Tax=Molothrus ater TaxID=84834 RepID=UPI0023E804B9|nr:uncharacterized protein LOC129046940 [Molothrus ater]